MEWAPVIVAVTAALGSLAASHAAWSTVATLVLLGVVASTPTLGSDVEALAAILVAMSTVAVGRTRVERAGILLVVAGLLMPTKTGSLPAGLVSVGPTLIVFGLTTALMAGSKYEARVALIRFGVCASLWLTAAVFVLLCVPAAPLGGPVDDLAASRAKVPITVLLIIGLSCFPLHAFLIEAGRRGSTAASAVIPLLGLATLSVLDFSPLVRGAAVGELAVVLYPLGVVTLVVGGALSLAHEDLRCRILAAQVGLAGWTVAIWSRDPAAARVLWATVSVASAVSGSVIARLEERYRSRERKAFGGLAWQHPTSAVTLGFSAIVIAKAAAGPLVMSRALPAAAKLSSTAVVVVLIAGAIYAASFADLLRGLLFGKPQLPEFTGPVFERVGIKPQRRRPLVDPPTLFAWGIPLVFVIGLSVAPYNALQRLEAANGTSTAPEPIPDRSPELDPAAPTVPISPP